MPGLVGRGAAKVAVREAAATVEAKAAGWVAVGWAEAVSTEVEAATEAEAAAAGRAVVEVRCRVGRAATRAAAAGMRAV